MARIARSVRPVPVISWPPVLPDDGWRGIAASSSGITEYWVRVPPGEPRARYAAALSAINSQLSLRSADEIALRFSKAPAPYRVFVILTLVVMEVSVINLMRMLLAKATSRAAEIGIHRALGAGRNTIFARQLLEGVLVSMVGSLLGLALAVPTVKTFDRLIPDSPIALAVTPSVVATALLVCLFAALVSGIYPAWRTASVAPGEATTRRGVVVATATASSLAHFGGAERRIAFITFEIEIPDKLAIHLEAAALRLDAAQFVHLAQIDLVFVRDLAHQRRRLLTPQSFRRIGRGFLDVAGCVDRCRRCRR